MAVLVQHLGVGLDRDNGAGQELYWVLGLGLEIVCDVGFDFGGGFDL